MTPWAPSTTSWNWRTACRVPTGPRRSPATPPQPPPGETPVSSLAAPYRPRTLRSELDARGRLPVAEVVALGVQLCGALGHIHRSGLVHRDVKPSNVIFVQGLPKLADLGLVATADEARSFVGTEGFIPPEGPGTIQADLSPSDACSTRRRPARTAASSRNCRPTWTPGPTGRSSSS